MGEETRELVRQGIVPVVLGNGRAAHRASRFADKAVFGRFFYL